MPFWCQWAAISILICSVKCKISNRSRTWAGTVFFLARLDVSGLISLSALSFSTCHCVSVTIWTCGQGSATALKQPTFSVWKLFVSSFSSTPTLILVCKSLLQYFFNLKDVYTRLTKSLEWSDLEMLFRVICWMLNLEMGVLLVVGVYKPRCYLWACVCALITIIRHFVEIAVWQLHVMTALLWSFVVLANSGVHWLLKLSYTPPHELQPYPVPVRHLHCRRIGLVYTLWQGSTHA